MSECKHSEYVQGEWISGGMDDEGDYQMGHWTEGYTRSTTRDIDLHRYRCTQCGEVMYYSQAARNWFVNSIPSPYIKGLS